MQESLSRRALRGFFIFAALTLTAGSEAFAQSTTNRFVSFQAFMDGVRSASSAQYVGAASSRIAGASDFAEMRQHIVSLYDSVHVTHSFLYGSQYFDCVPLMEQPSVRGLGITRIAEPPPSPPFGRAGAGPNPSASVMPQHSGYTRDKFGNAIACEQGTIPMRRVTLEEMSRFPTLHDFFSKGPGKAGQVGNNAATLVHNYAYTQENVTNFGGGSYLNIWNPTVPNTKNIFSLSQHWFQTTVGKAKTVQTVEEGWQHFPAKYGKGTKSVFFIYWTADGYSKTGCYNLDCKAFVQHDKSIMLGGEFDKYSVVGRAQQEFQLRAFLYNGNWWIYYNGIAVGYYPGKLWGNANLAKGSNGILFGGETTGTTSWPPMGSGNWPSGGFKQAAYQRIVHYYPTATTYKDATLTANQPVPKCYKADLTNNSTGDWHTYFYFGGPGGNKC